MKKFNFHKLILPVISVAVILGCKDIIENENPPEQVISIENNKITSKYCEGFGNYIVMDKDLVQISGDDSAYLFKYNGQNIEMVKTVNGSWGRIIHDSIQIFRSTDGNGKWTLSIYERDGDSWEYIQEISSRRNGSNFGVDIDIEGDYMVIGDPDFSWPVGYEGRAYIYHRTAEGWNLQNEFQAEEPVSHDEYGRFVALYNGFLIVGSDMVDRMHIYKFDNAWSLLRVDSIVGALSHFGNSFMLYDSYNLQLRSFTLESDGSFNYHLVNCDFDGRSVAQIGEKIEIKDNIALVAMELSDNCYVLQFDNNQWTEKMVISSGNASCTYLGLAITDTYLVLGSWDYGNQENAYVYFINY